MDRTLPGRCRVPQIVVADDVVTVKHAACLILVVGILAQSGGFFIHMLVGEPNKASVGTTVTVAGAVLLAILVLVYGLIAAP